MSRISATRHHCAKLVNALTSVRRVPVTVLPTVERLEQLTREGKLKEYLRRRRT